MKLKELQHLFQNKLKAHYLKQEIDTFFFMLSEFYFGIKRLDLALNPNLKVDEPHHILQALEALEKHVPIQYIIGKTEFYGLTFKVDEHTLIPRPETEELVDWILSEIENFDIPKSILDIGTGSGSIAVSLAKKLTGSKVYALDVSEEALEIAKGNGILNGVDVVMIKTDILKKDLWPTLFKNQKFDIIVSNPPYVLETEKLKMKANVLNYEPHVALFVEDNDPLLFYREITGFSKAHLKKGGMLFFEINEKLGNDMLALLSHAGFEELEMRQDIFGKDRMIKAIQNQ